MFDPFVTYFDMMSVIGIQLDIFHMNQRKAESSRLNCVLSRSYKLQTSHV